MRIRCVINGKHTDLEAAPDRRVVDLLREDLGLCGNKGSMRVRGMRCLHHSCQWGKPALLPDGCRPA